MVTLIRNKSERMRRFLVIILVAAFSAIIIIYLLERTKPLDKEILPSNENRADLSINKVTHKAMKDGFKQWDLTAEKASYFQNRNEILFDNINVIFFMKNGNQVDLTAKTGVLNTQTNDIIISENIVASMENRIMKTEKLHYLYKQHIIKTDSPIEIVGEAFSIFSERMILNLDTQKARFDGNVRSTFNEAINF